MFSLSSFVRQALLFVRELLGSDAAIHPRVDSPNAPARTLLQLWLTLCHQAMRKLRNALSHLTMWF
jgi:hypothetical protein